VFPQGLAPGDYEITITWNGPAGFNSVGAVFSVAGTTHLALQQYYANATVNQLLTPLPNGLAATRHTIQGIVRIDVPLPTAQGVLVQSTFVNVPTNIEIQVAALPSNQI